MNEQGYNMKENILYQDNQSAIKMEKNGRNSCTGNSRHIHIRYFFVKDRVDKGEVKIEYCPTEEMLADFYTKPLQGSLFRKFRDVIMGYKHISSLKSKPIDNKLKERVGNMTFLEKNVSLVSKGFENSANKNKKRVSFVEPPVTQYVETLLDPRSQYHLLKSDNDGRGILVN